MQTDTMDNFLGSSSVEDKGIFGGLDGYIDPDEKAEGTESGALGKEAEPSPPDIESAGPDREDIGEDNPAPEEEGESSIPEAESGDKDKEDTIEEKPASDVMYSAAQVASEIGVVKQTVHNYSEKFPEFLHPTEDPKGQKLFPAADLEVMRYICELKKKRMDIQEIKKRLSVEFKDRIIVTGDNGLIKGSHAMKNRDELANAISSLVEEQIRSFFEIGMNGIYTRLDSVSDSLNGINDSMKAQAEASDKNGSLIRSIEAEVSHNADAIKDINRNVNSKMDRSISRNEASINKMQESLDKTNELLSKEIKAKIDENIDGINGIQKDMERIRSSNINKKVDDLGKSLAESMSQDRKEREEKNRELFRMIEKAMTPPEYHPEDSREYKSLNDKYNGIKETFEKTKTALMNMQEKIDEQESLIEKQGKQLSVQTMQISALNGQIQRYKNRIQAVYEENEAFRLMLSNPGSGKDRDAASGSACTSAVEAGTAEAAEPGTDGSPDDIALSITEEIIKNGEPSDAPAPSVPDRQGNASEKTGTASAAGTIKDGSRPEAQVKLFPPQKAGVTPKKKGFFSRLFFT